MAVNQNGRIDSADMVALANFANGTPDLSKAVLPNASFYYDTDGNVCYRKILLSEIDEANLGTGYKVGDQLTGPGASKFNVESVNSVGGVIGLRVVTSGNSYGSASGGDPASPYALTGGSGSGVNIIFTMPVVGPRQDYLFSNPPLPTLTKIKTIFPQGANYGAGNVLTFAELPGLSVTVTAVNGSGAITAFSVADPGGIYLGKSVALPPNLNHLNAVGGSGTGAVFFCLYHFPEIDSWKTELIRLRKNTLDAYFPVPTAAKYVSGPWPKSAYGTAGFDLNSKKQAFYYEDTGHDEVITLSATTAVPSNTYGNATSWEYVSLPRCSFTWGLDTRTDAPNKKWLLKIKTPYGTGATPARLVGRFSLPAVSCVGISATYTGYGSSGYRQYVAPALTIKSNLGTFVLVKVFSGSPPTVPDRWEYQLDVDQVFPDGDYYVEAEGWFRATTDVPSHPYGVGQPPVTTWFDESLSYLADYDDFCIPDFKLSFSGGFSSVTYGPGVNTAGIHSTKDIKRIDITENIDWFTNAGYGISVQVGGRNGFGYGAYLVTEYQPAGKDVIYDEGDPYDLNSYHWVNTAPATAPVFWRDWLGPAFGATLTVPTNGYWVGTTPLVSDLRVVGTAKMPWNFGRLKRTSGGTLTTVNPMLGGDADNDYSNTRVCNAYDQSLNVEKQLEPPTWVASRYYSLGFTLLDANGNFQKVTTAGVAGSSAPTWSTDLGVVTADGAVNWTCLRVLKPTANVWQAATAYFIGDIILDSNGNLQTVSAAGTSGGSAPLWSTTDNGITNDNGVTWSAKLLNLKPLKPAVHRINPIPRYPVYWQNETITAIKPPASNASTDKTIWGTGNQWQNHPVGSGSQAGWQSGNAAKGWWIYTVAINRIQKFPRNISGVGVIGAGDGSVAAGDGTKGAGSGGTGYASIEVTIGCIRNGSFVAFGTYATGQTINVLWPIFTSDALVYQASERVEIQAVAIASTGAGVAFNNYTVTDPIAATYYTDIANLLALLQ